MSNPCGLDYCPYKEIIGEYASCNACAWNQLEEKEVMQLKNRYPGSLHNHTDFS